MIITKAMQMSGSPDTSSKAEPSICIVGAGSMGIVTGYHLGLGGAAVSFLALRALVVRLPN
jgi:ribulose 1,5-bisphosphate synthetase/thiazole synthase